MGHRQYRELDDSVKEKISLSSKNRPKPEWVKEKISQSMIDYWKTIKHRPTSGETF